MPLTNQQMPKWPIAMLTPGTQTVFQ